LQRLTTPAVGAIASALQRTCPLDGWRAASRQRDTSGTEPGERMKPTLIVNPADDRVFAAFAEILVDHGADLIGDFEQRLRAFYPRAVVHARALAGEFGVVWYVYREGHWISTRQIEHTTGGSERHVGSERRPALDRGIDTPGRRDSPGT
jgi:hypothetical protein